MPSNAAPETKKNPSLSPGPIVEPCKRQPIAHIVVKVVQSFRIMGMVSSLKFEIHYSLCHGVDVRCQKKGS